MTSATPSPCSCCCCSTTDSDNSNTSLTQTQVPPFMVTTSEFSISIKEIVILGLVFLLFIYSIFSFLHNWKKNYRDISSSCQFNRLAHDNTSKNWKKKCETHFWSGPPQQIFAPTSQQKLDSLMKYPKFSYFRVRLYPLPQHNHTVATKYQRAGCCRSPSVAAGPS